MSRDKNKLTEADKLIILIIKLHPGIPLQALHVLFALAWMFLRKKGVVVGKRTIGGKEYLTSYIVSKRLRFLYEHGIVKRGSGWKHMTELRLPPEVSIPLVLSRIGYSVFVYVTKEDQSFINKTWDLLHDPRFFDDAQSFLLGKNNDDAKFSKYFYKRMKELST